MLTYLPTVFRDDNRHILQIKKTALHGFTLVELTVVMSVMMILFSIGAPITIRFLQNYALTSDRDTVLSLLEWARTQSMANHLQSSHGVEITASSYIGFVGNTYATRNAAFDLVYPHSKSITTSGNTEVVFSPLSGRSANTSITFNNGLKQTSLTTDAEGAIDW